MDSRPPILRMSRIRQKLLRGERFNASTLAAELEVSDRTITRDIDFLRTHLNYEISFDFAENSFHGQPSPITML